MIEQMKLGNFPGQSLELLLCPRPRQRQRSAQSVRTPTCSASLGPQPTPIGSAGSDAIRDHVAATLSAAGSSVGIETGVGGRTCGNTTVVGRVEKVGGTAESPV